MMYHMKIIYKIYTLTSHYVYSGSTVHTIHLCCIKEELFVKQLDIYMHYAILCHWINLISASAKISYIYIHIIQMLWWAVLENDIHSKYKWEKWIMTKLMTCLISE